MSDKSVAAPITFSTAQAEKVNTAATRTEIIST